MQPGPLPEPQEFPTPGSILTSQRPDPPGGGRVRPDTCHCSTPSSQVFCAQCGPLLNYCCHLHRASLTTAIQVVPGQGMTFMYVCYTAEIRDNAPGSPIHSAAFTPGSWPTPASSHRYDNHPTATSVGSSTAKALPALRCQSCPLLQEAHSGGKERWFWLWLCPGPWRVQPRVQDFRIH
jgi:hypothetical protein